MNQQLITYLPVAFVLLLLIAERLSVGKGFALLGRDGSMLGLYGIGWGIRLALATYLLLPYIKIFVPLQIFSVASWEIPLWLNATLSFLIIDFIQYWNHRLHHMVGPLWRLHRLHHSDKKVDALTTWRHHPLEYISGWLIVTAVFVLFDLPMVVMVAYAFVAGIVAALSHTNFLLNNSAARVVAWVFVTPNAHRLHHAQDYKASNSNFGTVFLFWDRLFGTYVCKSKSAVQSTPLGVDQKQAPKSENLLQYLINPAKSNAVIAANKTP